MPLRNLDPRFTSMLGALGLEGLAGVLAESEAETSVRLHPLRGEGLFEGAEAVAWCHGGRYLAERPDFTRQPAMHQGRYYVQEASSMFVAHVVASLTVGCGPLAVLDACAAPGGKTTAMADVLPERSLVVANELAPKRAAALVENVVKWGLDSAIITRGDSRRLGRLGDTFDIVLVDAPCSGEGMMRKEPVAVEQWCPELVEECAARQRDIVDALWPAVRPGGYMIYSTCTFNRREDEEVVEHLIQAYGAEPVGVPVDPAWGLTEAVGADFPAYRFIPGRTRGEGLFMAVLRKGGEPSGRSAKPVSPNSHPLADRITEPSDMTFSVADGRVNAFPARWEPLRREVARATTVIHSGIDLGIAAGRDFAPTQTLAMSRRLRRGAFPEAEVDEPTALAYLRRQAVTLPPATPRGYVLLTHGGYPLGFVKNLGSRANNLYPAEWRILSTH